MQGQAQLRMWSMGGATSPKTMFSSTEQGEERKTTLKMKPHRVRKPFQVSCLAQVSKVARNIQGVHKVRVHFKKIITLIVFAIEIICKKDLKEENRYFLRFY